MAMAKAAQQRPAHGEDEALEMDTGGKDEDIYDETGREKQVEDDGIADWEEEFVEGYEDGAICARCGKELGGNPVEREIGNRIVRFCSVQCATGPRKRAKQRE